MKEQIKKLVAFVTSALMALALVPGIALAQDVNYSGAGVTSGANAATITVTNPTKGQTYAVYKLFDATTQNIGTTENQNNVIAYSADSIPQGLTDYFQRDGQGNVTVTDGHETINEAESAALKSWTESATAVASAVSDGSQPLSFNNLPYGYYVVTTSLGAGAVSVTSTNPTGTVNDKNTTSPDDQTKNIVVDGQEVSSSTAKIGDTISYKVTFTANNYEGDGENATKMTQYVVTDTNSGLDIDTSTVLIKIQKQNGTSPLGDDQYASSSRKATIEKADNNSGTVTITIPWVTDDDAQSFLYDGPATVTITYDATLTSTTGTNTVQVNNRTTTPTTNVYTAEYDLTKVDADDQNKTLSGAEFDLYDASTDGTQIRVSQKTSGVDGAYVVDPNGNAKIKTDANGHFTIEGLKQGTNYYLQETKAPAGYTLKSGRIELNASTGAKTANETVTQKVTNSKGHELPTTGGMGTTLFTVVGAALVVAAGVLLVTRRRMQQ